MRGLHIGQTAISMARTRTKYNAKPVTIDGMRFASTKEGRRYSELKLLQQAGHISGLQMQVTYRLIVHEQLICKYIADFVYLENGEMVVEDVKGKKTREYRIKVKLMKAIYGIVIRET